MKPVRLAILWHMHQPLYREPATGDVPHALGAAPRDPRLQRHGLDPGAPPRGPVHGELHPGAARAARGLRRGAGPGPLPRPHRARPGGGPRARGAPPACSTPSSWWTGNNVAAVPRYLELLRSAAATCAQVDLERGGGRPSPRPSYRPAGATSTWRGWASGRWPTTRRCGRSGAKGRDFDDADVACVLAAQQRILAGVVPRWRALAERGQVELSTTPYYHPILPLVCDTDAAARALPGAAAPAPLRLARGRALARAGRRRESHARRFGEAARGHVAGGGGGLARGAGGAGRRGRALGGERRGRPAPVAARGGLEAPLALPPLARRRRRPGEIAMLFRDRALSDVSASPTPGSPARHAVARTSPPTCARWARRGGPTRQPGPATVGVFLDGENAWEHYPQLGPRVPRRASTARSRRAPEIETVTLSEAVAEPAGAGDPAHPLRVLDRGLLPHLDRPRARTARPGRRWGGRASAVEAARSGRAAPSAAGAGAAPPATRPRAPTGSGGTARTSPPSTPPSSTPSSAAT